MTRLLRALREASLRSVAPGVRERLSGLAIDDAGHGYDALGLNRDWVLASTGIARWVHDRYFRVVAHGIEHVPTKGAAILASNHSGLLPFDAAMLYTDLVLRTRAPRVPRIVVDRFVPLLPVVGTWFARVGAVVGTPGNCRHLLERGELLIVFPEGAPGIGKGFRKRYQLQDWRRGHAELAIRLRAPVVPVAVIGAEESWPQLARLDLHPFGAPYLPVPGTLLPLPLRWHIHYGEPLVLHEGLAPEDADDPAVSERAALRVKVAVEELIARGLAERGGLL